MNKSRNFVAAALSILSFCITYQTAIGQSSGAERIVNNAQNSTESKVNQKIDQSLNDLMDGKLFKKKQKTANSNAVEGQSNAKSGTETSIQPGSGNSPTDLKVYSKFDFVSGDKLLYFEDFADTETGDFPSGWNTNASAEVVTFNQAPGKWLSITKDGFFQPDMLNDLPENCTIEFDVFNRYRTNNILSYSFSIYKSDNPRRDIGNEVNEAAFRFYWEGCTGNASYYVYEKGEAYGKNENLTAKGLRCTGNDFEEGVFARFSIWRQKNRLRIYVNEEKVVDVPQAFNSSYQYNVFKLGTRYLNYANEPAHNDEFMISNLRFAVGAPDTRHKLTTDGRFSSTGILFDIDKATVRPESYGILKEIAGVLTDNPALKLTIVGHTSNDGNAAANLELSKQRAAEVKKALVHTFGIDASRLETDGKGSSQPADTAGTAAARANNRRVEFIKQ